MRPFTLLGIAVLWLAAPAAAWSAETIRVLLYQDVPRVEVSTQGEGFVFVALPGGEVRHTASRVVVKPLAGAVEVNDEPFSIDRVRIHGGDRDLRVVAPVTVGPPRPAEETPRPAVFTRLADRASSSPAARRAPPKPAQPEPFVVGGDLEILVRDAGLWVVNRLDLEAYVLGVVPAEMQASWHPEALKAQAVATRTYALHQMMLHAERDYDVVATIHDQVYRGRAGAVGSVWDAVEATKGQVLTHEERPILAVFSSTAAGPTEDVANVWAKDLPYLKGVECPFDRESPYYEWRTAFPLGLLESRLRAEGWDVGSIATFTPSAYSRAGRVSWLRILHSRGELLLSGQDLRRLVGYRVIPSTRFTVDALGAQIELSGYGNGHAVGLCQWGTKELAERGYPYDAILRYYFPGTVLSRTYRLDPPPAPVP